ncbi:ubiquitin carboxyl-terminal hydrolase 9 [Lathyrus oleraceus]|uniref:ubiquitin carboxyl-terminal hydrolase 9 n=1 Tax=Pisum sativum TaxID=3888 RepID=UPI0021D2355D|nr:ubiquitin carboxyl-terminal hydrolase 9-like [Pisum sativum]
MSLVPSPCNKLLLARKILAAMSKFSSAVKTDLEKFDGRINFDLWKIQFKDVLIQIGLQKELKKNISNMGNEKLEELDLRVSSIICMSLAKNILANIHVSDHLSVLYGIVSELETIGVKIDDEDKDLRLMLSLSSSYEHIKPVLIYGKESLSFEEVSSKIEGEDNTSSNSVLVDRGRPYVKKTIKQACIWDYFNLKKHTLLTASDHQTLEDANMTMDHDILLEVSVDTDRSSHSGVHSIGNELALVPLEPPRSSVSIAGGPTLSNGHSTGSGFNLYQGSSVSSSLTTMDDNYDIYRGERGGLAGLQNLGNTCFMNSTLQCLVHTPPLVEFFLQDYNDEINRDNPLGMSGELALAFGDLLRKLWSSGRTAIAPRAFKGKLARFAPQFSGYNQHDSQELLAFLLDGLHEDLNRVKQKPYIEMKDSDNRPDEEVAYECWKNHMARNDSLIVDECQVSQYKSTLVCPECGKISITFDPFMYLSLPLPSTVTRAMTITVFYCDGSGLPMPYTVNVLKHGCCRDLCQALGTACCLKSDEMLLLAEVYENKIYRYLENPLESLTSIKDEEHIVAYRLKNGARKTKLEILHQCPDNVKGGDRKIFGTPLVTYLVEDPQYGANIEAYVHRMLAPLGKAHSSTRSHEGKENGFISGGSDERFYPSSKVKKSKEESDKSDEEVSEKEETGLFVRRYNRYLKRNKLKHTDKGLVNFKNTHPLKKDHKKEDDEITCYECGKLEHYRTICPNFTKHHKSKDKVFYKTMGKSSKGCRAYISCKEEVESCSSDSCSSLDDECARFFLME